MNMNISTIHMQVHFLLGLEEETNFATITKGTQSRVCFVPSQVKTWKLFLFFLFPISRQHPYHHLKATSQLSR